MPPNTPVDLATGDGEMDDLLYMPSLPEEDKEEPHVKVATT